LRKLEISLKELSAKKEKAIKVSDDPQTRGYFETLEKTLVRKIDAMNKENKVFKNVDSIDLTKAKGREAFD
jgi:CHASE3 domain sensor protein